MQTIPLSGPDRHSPPLPLFHNLGARLLDELADAGQRCTRQPPSSAIRSVMSCEGDLL